MANSRLGLRTRPGLKMKDALKLSAGSVKTIQAFSIDLTGVASNTATLSTAVIVANSIIVPSGWINAQNTDNPQLNTCGVTLTNTTTVTATAGGAGNALTVQGFVVEFDASIIQTSVQYFTIAIAAAAASGTYTISPGLSATTKGLVVGLGLVSDSTGTTTFRSWYGRLVLTNTTTVTGDRSSTTGNVTLYGCVVEFK